MLRILNKRQSLVVALLSTIASFAQEQPENKLTEFKPLILRTASREAQVRSEVPRAIAKIDSTTIQKTKAVTLDQVLNQTAGVYMSTSSVASNDQHFMALRSPISTKALFLYLEDELPIRPTSVFNHNALLEMNDLSIANLEVLKGSGSSIYGSEAIGGVFNFITKNPTQDFTASIGYEGSTVGFNRYRLEFSDKANEKLGIYTALQLANRNNGPISHSDYYKLAATFKTVYSFSKKIQWTTMLNLVNYNSDMSGSISEENYVAGDYSSDQTFTNREAFALRLRTGIQHNWNKNNKTQLRLLYRNNRMDQNPSYRISQFRGTGEVNSNSFQSFALYAQHSVKLPFWKSKLIVGEQFDYSPQNYYAKNTTVTTVNNINTAFQVGDFHTNYNASTFNRGTYAQFETNLFNTEVLRLTTALRHDLFVYKQDNLLDGSSDERTFQNFTPNVGLNVNTSRNSGLYLNYSQGFTPPQLSTIYRGSQQSEPSRYNNAEIGAFLMPTKDLRFDFSLYNISGSNTLVTLRDTDDIFYTDNAGKTRSTGIELGVNVSFLEYFSFVHQASLAQHRYIEFTTSANGSLVSYDDTDMEIAPKYISNTTLSFDYPLFKEVSFNAAILNESVGKYNTSLEGQANGATTTYGGHSIWGLKVGAAYHNIEFWTQLFNVFDHNYASRASYNRFRGYNSYTVGTPRALHFGAKYNF